ncbi:MAG: ATPase, T2SS/T4P/T4SS family, partial [Algiphilus sp.]
SIPTRSTLEQILGMLPPLSRDQAALVVGAGSGYLAAVMAQLVGRVYVVEKEPEIANIALSNLAQLSVTNVELIIGDAEAGVDLPSPCHLVLSSTFLEKPTALVDVLREEGFLINLERTQGRLPRLVRYQKLSGALGSPTTLGSVDFRRNTDDVLIDLGVLDETAIEEAKNEARAKKAPLLEILRQKTHIEDTELYRKLGSQKRGLSFIELQALLPSLDARLFPQFSCTFLDRHRVIPVSMQDKQLVVVSDDPDAQIEAIERLTTAESVRLLLITPADFRRLWSHLTIAQRSNGAAPPPLETLPDFEATEDLAGASDTRVSPYLVSVYEGILLEAVTGGASDIHIERYGERVRIRLRIDGELQDLAHYKITTRELPGMVNVIKVRAELDIAERRLPQGGRSKLRFGQSTYDLRVQTQPSLYGEHVIIRLLRQTGRAMTMQELGMSPKVARNYQRLLNNPSGLVLVVGPTGSGKSTTLYAGLQELADDGRRKVITVEDPIEYSIDNIQQTRVRPDIGFGFADAMRAFVRQDPDVILVGEIRDRETALEAVRASQTGHVVLSTLHCNDSVDSLQRLYDLGIQANSIASELLAVIAQRLARRICSECRTEVEPNPALMKELF